MNKVYFTFEGDVLIKNTPCGENICKAEIVIDKETFLECMKRWMVESEERG